MAFRFSVPRTYPPHLERLRDLSLFSGLALPELAIVDDLLHQRHFLANTLNPSRRRRRLNPNVESAPLTASKPSRHFIGEN